jgi:hypothetical protein
MSRDGWAERAARDLLHSSWRPDEDVADRRIRVIIETVTEIERLDEQLHREHEDLEILATLVIEKFQIEREIAERRLAAATQILEADKERRTLDAAIRRAEARVRRATEGPREGVISRHVQVDRSAWQALGREARRTQTTLMILVGAAITEEAARLTAGELSGDPSSRRRRSPGEAAPHPTNRVVRLLLTEDCWQGLADAAAACGLTVARYAGEVIEATAHDVGWRTGH